MFFDDVADGGKQAWHVAPAHPAPAFRIKHGFKLVSHESHVTAPAEHGTDHAGQRHRPGKVLQVLGIDEYFEWASAPVALDVVDGDVEGVGTGRPLDLVGEAFQRGVALQRLAEIDHATRFCGFAHGYRRRIAICRPFCGDRHKHCARYGIRPVRCAAFETHCEGLNVDIAKIFKAGRFWTIDGLGYRAVDKGLERGLHGHMLAWREAACGDERGRARCLAAADGAETAGRKVFDIFVMGTPVLTQDAAQIGEFENRLNSARDVASEQRNCTGRRDRRQAAIAQTVRGDIGLHRGVEALDIWPAKKRVARVERERAFLRGKPCACPVGGILDYFHPSGRLPSRVVLAIIEAAENERVRQPRDAKANAALSAGFLGLGLERIARKVDDIIEKTNGGRHARFEFRRIDPGALCKGMVDQCCEVDRSQKTCAIGWQWLLAARISGRYRLAIVEIIFSVDAVDEDHARFGIIVSRAHHPVPQVAGGNRLVDFAVKHEVPRFSVAHGCHEGIRHENRQIEVSEPLGIGFGRDEILDVGMIAT